MCRVQRAERQPGQVLASAQQPRALSESSSGEEHSSRVFPLRPQSHTTHQARGFPPEEQSLGRNFSIKVRGNRNNKEWGKAGRGERCVSSQSPCTLGRMSQEAHPLLRIQASTGGAAAGTWKQHSGFTLRCF